MCRPSLALERLTRVPPPTRRGGGSCSRRRRKGEPQSEHSRGCRRCDARTFTYAGVACFRSDTRRRRCTAARARHLGSALVRRRGLHVARVGTVHPSVRTHRGQRQQRQQHQRRGRPAAVDARVHAGRRREHQRTYQQVRHRPHDLRHGNGRGGASACVAGKRCLCGWQGKDRRPGSRS